VQRRNGTLWTTLYWSALRLGEALALKVDDVDLERRSLTVFGRKTRRWRQLPICAPLARVLARWLPETGDGPELFPRLDVETGGTLGVTTMSKAWCAFQRSVGIPDHRRMRAHDLRHAFGRHATAEGLSLRVIQHMMGHASIQTTLLYADCELGDVLAQMERCGFVNGR
jgi:integrase